MKQFFIYCSLVFFLTACAETAFISHVVKQVPTNDQTTFKIGNPYKISGRKYHPRESYKHSETGIASWYGPNFHGKKTANGETYNMYALTAAHRTLQMPSIVKVTNLENGRSVKVRINDRGPFAHGRVIDMSKRGAELLGFKNQGTARVRIDVLPEESRIVAQAAKQGSLIDVKQALRLARNKSRNLPSVEIAANPQAQTQLVTGKPLSLSDPDSLASLQKQAEPFNAITTIDDVRVEPLQARAIQSLQPTARQQAIAPSKPSIELNEVEYNPVTPSNIYIQAGSFSVKSNAYNLADRLKRIGNINIQEASINGRTFYRVRMGPINTVTQADMLLAEIWQSEKLNGARIIVD